MLCAFSSKWCISTLFSSELKTQSSHRWRRSCKTSLRPSWAWSKRKRCSRHRRDNSQNSKTKSCLRTQTSTLRSQIHFLPKIATTIVLKRNLASKYSRLMMLRLREIRIMSWANSWPKWTTLASFLSWCYHRRRFRTQWKSSESSSSSIVMALNTQSVE